MFLGEYVEPNSKIMKNNMCFDASYRYWIDTLFEDCMKIFTLENLPASIPAHEPLVIGYLKGYAPIVKLSNGKWIAAVESGLNGLTNYYDMFTHVQFSTPLTFGKREIDKHAFIIRTTELKNPLFPKIQRYASLLSHCEISLIDMLVDLRDTDIIEAMNNSNREAIEKYLYDRYNGKKSVLVNKGFSMIRHNFKPQKSQNDANRLWDLRSSILADFWEEIGVKKANQKREREITSEVNANTSLLKLNIRNMHETMQEDWNKFNEATGNNVKVICNVSYDSDEAEDKEVKEGVEDVEKGVE